MTAPAGDRRLTVPEGTRLVHIGLPKTGSSGTQGVAAALRPQLLEHGVRYAGEPAILHTVPMMAFVRANSASAKKRAGASSSGLAGFDALMSEVNAETERRVWLSSEDITGADDRAAAALVERLGAERTHAVITLRALGDRMISLWQQRVRNGRSTESLDEWMRAVLPAEIDGAIRKRSRKYLQFSDKVLRWVDLLGPENVTLIVVDKSEPTRVYRTFEELLDLPSGFLELPEGDAAAKRSNRGLSPLEIEFARHVNIAAKEFGLSQKDYQRLIHQGAFARIQYLRSPGADEGRLVVSDWAADRLVAAARREVDVLAGRDLRVVGDLESLVARPPVGDMEASPNVPIDAAVLAVLGVTARAMGTGPASPRVASGKASAPARAGVLHRIRQIPHELRKRLRSR